MSDLPDAERLRLRLRAKIRLRKYNTSILFWFDLKYPNNFSGLHVCFNCDGDDDGDGDSDGDGDGDRNSGGNNVLLVGCFVSLSFRLVYRYQIYYLTCIIPECN